MVNHNLLVTLFFNKFHSSIRPDSFAWSGLFPCLVPVLVSFAGSKRWFGGSKRSVTGLLAKHKCFVLQLIRCQFAHNQKKIKAPSIGLVRYRPLRLLSCRLVQPVCCFGAITMGRQEEKSSRSLPENLIFYAPMGELVLYNV